MRAPNRLAWIGVKSLAQSGNSRKNRPGFKSEHTQALIENASRTLAVEIDKALTPPSEVVGLEA